MGCRTKHSGGRRGKLSVPQPDFSSLAKQKFENVALQPFAGTSVPFVAFGFRFLGEPKRTSAQASNIWIQNSKVEGRELRNSKPEASKP